MQRWFVFAIALLPSGVASAQTTAGSAQDETAIRKARRDHNTASTKHDAKAPAMQFATDRDRVTGTGEVFQGWAGVENGELLCNASGNIDLEQMGD